MLSSQSSTFRIGVLSLCILGLSACETSLDKNGTSITDGNPLTSTSTETESETTTTSTVVFSSALFAVGTDASSDSFDSLTGVVGDIDHDGDIDFLVAYGSTRSIRLYRGDGAGGFTGTDVGDSGASRLVLADVNQDGWLDLLATRVSPNTNRVYLNDGAGNFLAGSDLHAQAVEANSLSIGDFDGDGDIDLFIANGTGTDNQVLLGDGTGSFTAGAAVPSESAHDSYTTDVGDFDHDGDLDVIVGKMGNAPRLYTNDGSATFSGGATLSGGGTSYYTVIARDINKDGHLDVIAGGVSTDVWLGDGTGGFASAVNLGSSTSGRGLSVGDIDGDGDLDVHQTLYGDYDRVYLNNGDGTFASQSYSDAGGDALNSTATLLADFDGDSDLDLLVLNSSQSDRLYLGSEGPQEIGNPIECPGRPPCAFLVGHGGSTYDPSVDVTGSTGTSVDTVVGDFNHDGNMDFIVINLGTNDLIFLGDGTGGFDGGNAVAAADTYNSRKGVAADFNNDGNLDLAIAAQSAADRIYLGDGAGGFDSGSNIDAATTSGNNGIAAGDLNGDGNVDIVVPSQIYLGNGDGTFTLGDSLTPYNPYSVDLHDYNNDGKLDLVEGFNGTNTIRLGNGDGTFGSPSNISADTRNTAEILGVDINNDGNLDVVCANSGEVHSVHLGNGDGTFGAEATFGSAINAVDIAVGDIDGDGNVDLIYGINSFTSPLELYLGDGTGGFSAMISLTQSKDRPDSPSVADFDHDGKLEVVSGTAGSSDASQYWNQP